MWLETPMHRHFLAFAMLLASLTIGQLADAAPAPAGAQSLVYRVQHSRYGNIGIYTNQVEKNGNTTTVTTRADIKVSILGVVLYRQEASRQERWAGDRLVSFHGVTTVNGNPYELNGAVDGNSFVLSSPNGQIVAPANVKIANPWSPDVLKGDMILTPDRGRIENVQVKDAGETAVEVSGRQIRAKRYEINRLDGTKRYEVWLDERGTPVRFITFNNNGTVTFILT